ncbi:MAG: Methionyl-tRNA formyltransferase, partial [Candidatus Nomurabacteria bacterium GW2011_GWB1_47_6]
KTTIDSSEYNIQLSGRLFKIGGELLVRVLPDYLTGKLIPQPQDHSQATFTRKFTPEDGKIDWQKSAREIYNQIRALNPEPGTFTLLNSRSDNLTGWTSNILKITKANLSTSDVERLAAGQIIKDGKTLLASTGNGWLEILELQPAGKKPMPAAAFLNGYRGNWPIQCG